MTKLAAVAENEASGTPEGVTESLDTLIAKAAKGHMGAGRPTETTPEPSEKPDADEEPADEVGADEDAAGGDEGEAASEPESTAAWSMEEVGNFLEANPKWFDTLDKDDWQRVPRAAVRFFKASSADLTRREQAIARRERALAEAGSAGNKREGETQPGNGRTSRDDAERIFDMLHDPETVEEGLALLLERNLPGIMKKVGVPLERLQETDVRSRIEESFDSAMASLAARGVEPAGNMDADKAKAVAQYVENDPELLELVESGNPKHIKLAFQSAGAIVFQTWKSATERAEQKRLAQAEEAKRKAKQAKERANAATPASAAVTARGGSGVSDDDPSLSLDDRIRRGVSRNLAQVRGR